MTNAEVIRRYFDPARDPAGKGRSNSGSLSFDGPDLLSYRTPIGRLTPDGRFHLLQDRFSRATSGHQRMAARHCRRVLGEPVLVSTL